VNIQLIGALAFGILIGWYVYYINRHRKNEVQMSDLVTLIGVIGGAAVLSLFPAESDLFGAYGIGLAIGFFAYFIFLMIFVYASPNFGSDWFLDGRRIGPDGTPGYAPSDQPDTTAMNAMGR
jgi:predicted permease